MNIVVSICGPCLSLRAARKLKASKTCTLAWNAVFLPNANDKSSSRDYAGSQNQIRLFGDLEEITDFES